MIWNPKIKSVCFTPCGFVMAKIALRSLLLPVLVNFEVMVLVIAVLEAISLTGGESVPRRSDTLTGFLASCRCSPSGRP